MIVSICLFFNGRIFCFVVTMLLIRVIYLRNEYRLIECIFYLNFYFGAKLDFIMGVLFECGEFKIIKGFSCRGSCFYINRLY